MVTAEPDGAAYFESRDLNHDQLRALLSNPPEAIAAVQLAEADTIVARLLA